MPTLSADTLQYLRSSPYFAALEGRDQMSQDLFNAKFEKLPENIRTFLLAPETADDVAYIVTTNRLDERYMTALGKIIASAVLGEVPVGSIGDLLQKLDIPTDQAANITQSIVALLEPIMTAKARAVVGSKPKEIPPLTKTVGGAKPVGGIIDLRTKSR